MVVIRKSRLARTSVLAVSLVGLAAFLVPVAPASAASQAVGLVGTSSPRTGSYVPSGDGDVTQAEFPGQLDTAAGPGPYSGSIVDRSLSKHAGRGVAVTSGTTLTLSRIVQLGLSNPNSKTLTVNAGGALNGGSTGYVIGSLQRTFAAAGSQTFQVGATRGAATSSPSSLPTRRSASATATNSRPSTTSSTSTTRPASRSCRTTPPPIPSPASRGT